MLAKNAKREHRVTCIVQTQTKPKANACFNVERMNPEEKPETETIPVHTYKIEVPSVLRAVNFFNSD